MSQPRLIMIEGMPSAGKSTTGLHIVSQLQNDGQQAHWAWEPEVLNTWFGRSKPITNLFPDPPLYDLDAVLADWQDFVTMAAASDTIWVMDGMLSYTIVSPLLALDTEPDILERARTAVHELCAALPTSVVHIVGDAHTLLEKSYVYRGEWWRTKITKQIEGYRRQKARGLTGEAGVVAFYEAAQTRVRSTLDSRWPLFVLDRRQEDRAATYRALAEFVGYPYVPQTLLDTTTLGHLVGSYRSLDPASESPVLCCEMQEHGLVLTNGESQISSLEALGTHQLRMQGTPYLFTFDETANVMDVTEADGRVERYQRQ